MSTKHVAQVNANLWFAFIVALQKIQSNNDNLMVDFSVTSKNWTQAYSSASHKLINWKPNRVVLPQCGNETIKLCSHWLSIVIISFKWAFVKKIEKEDKKKAGRKKSILGKLCKSTLEHSPINAIAKFWERLEKNLNKSEREEARKRDKEKIHAQIQFEWNRMHAHMLCRVMKVCWRFVTCTIHNICWSICFCFCLSSLLMKCFMIE